MTETRDRTIVQSDLTPVIPIQNSAAETSGILLNRIVTKHQAAEAGVGLTMDETSFLYGRQRVGVGV